MIIPDALNIASSVFVSQVQGPFNPMPQLYTPSCAPASALMLARLEGHSPFPGLAPQQAIEGVGALVGAGPRGVSWTQLEDLVAKLGMTGKTVMGADAAFTAALAGPALLVGTGNRGTWYDRIPTMSGTVPAPTFGAHAIVAMPGSAPGQLVVLDPLVASGPFVASQEELYNFLQARQAGAISVER